MTIILASTSPARHAMLSAAGVAFEVVKPQVDESAAKAAMLAEALSPRDIADALATLKARRVSQSHRQALVIGCDQTLEADDGTLFVKPETRDELARQLRALSAKPHKLYSAATIALDAAPIWRHVDTVTMVMRPLSDDFIADYVANVPEDCLHCVGGYQIEAAGIQLFSRISGSHFAILGMPLLPLLEFLRVRGELPI